MRAVLSLLFLVAISSSGSGPARDRLYSFWFFVSLGPRLELLASLCFVVCTLKGSRHPDVCFFSFYITDRSIVEPIALIGQADL